MRTHPAMRPIPLDARIQYNLSFLAEHFLPQVKLLQQQKEAARARIAEHLKAGGKGRIVPVDRVRGITPEEFRKHYLHKRIPVILEGAASHFKCVREWSFDNFRQRFGHETINLVNRPGLVDDDYVDERELTEEMNFGDFLSQVEAGGAKYMRFAPLFDKFPELANDVDWKFLRSMPDYSVGMIPQLFIGGEGRGTPIHNAMTTFLFVQVVGVKRWTFVPNRYLAVLNPPADARGYNHSEAVVERPDPDKFPGLENIDCMEAVVNPGDILFNPSWNWHSVVNHSPTIGIRFGMLRPVTMVGGSLTLTTIRLVGGRHQGVPLRTTIESARDAAVAVLRQVVGGSGPK